MTQRVCAWSGCGALFECDHSTSRRYCEQHLGGHEHGKIETEDEEPFFDRAVRALDIIRPLPPVPAHITATRVEDMHFDTPQEAVALFSDLHYGSLIDPRTSAGMARYNPDIARARLSRWRDVLLRFTQMDQALLTLDTLHLFALGDDIEGHGEMFATQKLSMAESVGFQVLGFVDYMSNVLLDFLSRYKKIKVYKVRGNHGRITAKARDDYPPDNLELLAWNNIADRVRRQAGGEWSEGPNGIRVLEGGLIDFNNSPAFMMFVDVLGHSFALRHGDRIKGVASTYTGLVDNKYRLNAIMGEVINYYCIAHHHEPQSIENEIGGGSMVNGCQKPGARVLCGGTPTPIEQLRAGSFVLGEDGREHVVQYVRERHYAGDMVSIQPAGLPPVEFTGDHPIIVRKGARGSPHLLAARHVTPQHYVLSPAPVRDRRAPTMAWPFSPYVLGLYLAEGSSWDSVYANSHRSTRACWTFALDEKDTLAKVVADEIPGARVVVDEKHNTAEVHSYNRGVVGVLNPFGHTAATKSLPEEFLYQPHAFLFDLLRGWFDGDGCYSGDAATISSTLAWQMWSIARKCGLSPAIHRRPAKQGHNAAWVLHFSTTEVQQMRAGTRPSLHGRRKDEWRKVFRTGTSFYEGPVFNLKADGFYVTDGIAVSNCFVGPSLLSVSMGRPAANIPSQEFFLMHPKHGQTHNHRIRLASKEEMRDHMEFVGR